MPTPIGNLGDITLRALDVLRRCDLLVAEDTRVARKLLGALDLPSKQLWSYREQNAATVTAAILERASRELVAVVSDAGMPAIADPGRQLITAARDAGVAVEVLPGPTAFVCAAVLSGFDLGLLRFAGFIPRSASERALALSSALADSGTTVFFDSPHRITLTLETLHALAPQARIFVGRELTKYHEQQALGTPSDVLAQLAQPVRGEIVLVIAAEGALMAHSGCRAGATDAEIDAEIDSALARGAPAASIAKALTQAGYGERRTLYERVVARRRRAGSTQPETGA